MQVDASPTSQVEVVREMGFLRRLLDLMVVTVVYQGQQQSVHIEVTKTHGIKLGERTDF